MLYTADVNDLRDLPRQTVATEIAAPCRHDLLQVRGSCWRVAGFWNVDQIEILDPDGWSELDEDAPDGSQDREIWDYAEVALANAAAADWWHAEVDRVG